VVRFNGQNNMEAEAKSAYVQRVLRENDYTKHFRDGWHDAFVGKRMTTWLDWKQDTEEVVLRFLGAPTAQVNQQVQSLGESVNVDRSGLQSLPVPSMTGAPQFVHTGTLVLTVDASYINMELIQPEFVFRDPGHSYACDAGWNSCRIDASKIDLIDQGYHPDDVERLTYDTRWGESTEDNARKQHDQSFQYDSHTRLPGDQEEVTIYRTRTYLRQDEVDVEGFEATEDIAIYDICWADGKVLRWADGTPCIKVIDEMDVYEWCEYKISHAEFGLCTADVEAHTQKASSALKRGILDHVSIVNNPTWEANSSAIKDMRDLYDGVIAGVIETEPGQPVGQVKALDMPQMSPMTGLVLQMLDADSDERSGMSAVSRGLNQDVVSQQNAENLIDKMASRGERRVAMAARSFANDYLIPLMQGIVKLAMKHDKSQSGLESGGRDIIIAPQTWQDTEHECEVEVALTPGEAREMSIQLLAMDMRMSQDEALRPLYGLQRKHALYDTVFELIGIKDSTKFMDSPEDPRIQQQMMMAQQQAQQQQAQQQQLMMAQLQMSSEQIAQGWAKINNDIMDDMTDNTLDRDQFNMDRYFKEQELEIERSQQRAATITG
jgi:hypothetical protein